MTERLFELTLANGEAVLIRRLSPFIRMDIQTTAKDLYPDVDPKAYEPASVPNAINEDVERGLKIQMALDSDGYKAAMRAVEDDRWLYIYDQTLRAGAVADTLEGYAVTLERLSDQLGRNLPLATNAPDDPFLQLVLYVLITEWTDCSRIYALACAPLSEEALAKAARFRGNPLQRAGRVDNRTAESA